MNAAQYALWLCAYNQALQQGKPAQKALELADRLANQTGV